MKYGLAAVAVRIYYDAITIFGKSLITRDPRGGKKKMPERLAMVVRRRVERVEVLARDKQIMNGRLRCQVFESNANVVLKYPCRRYFTGNYLAEYAVVFGHVI